MQFIVSWNSGNAQNVIKVSLIILFFFTIIKCAFVSAFSAKQYLTSHQKSIHNTKKDWVCDCCGSSFGNKKNLKYHMMTHLPPSFACSKCNRKFVQRSAFKMHLKRHQGILNEVCKHCNKGYLTKISLNSHITYRHFAKMCCGVSNCSYKTGYKGNYKVHLKENHKYSDRTLIEKLLDDLEKLKPDHQLLKYQ